MKRREWSAGRKKIWGQETQGRRKEHTGKRQSLFETAFLTFGGVTFFETIFYNRSGKR